MDNFAYGELEFRYESSSYDSYLVIRAQSMESILNYQVEMITGNTIENVIAMGLKQKDENVDMYFNITSKLSLKQFLKRKVLEKNEFIGIAQSIIKILIDCRDYLLYDNCFLLTEDYIYINPETYKVSLVYIPCRTYLNTCEKIKELMFKLITVSADITESINDSYLQKIINFLKIEGFNLQDMNNFLMGLKVEDIFESKSDENMIMLETKDKKDVDQLEKQGNRHNVPKNKLGDKVILFIVISAQVLIIFFLVRFHDFFKSLNQDVWTTYIALVLVIASCEGLILKRLFCQRNSVVKKGAENEVESLSSGNVWSLTEELNKSFEMQINNTNNSETVILSIQKDTYPYLIDATLNSKEKIPITKSEFIIGRLKGYVDYEMSNISVGKVHAEVSLYEGKYIIKDLNSRNGTFINSEQIESNREFEIKNNDRISIANSDYIFVIPN